ncbi:phage recombination protein Bet [Dermabacteraceae bacterium P7006]
MTALAIPKNGNVEEWTPQEKALVEAAGLVSRGTLAPRATVEAFLSHCHRAGLDPIARQIYAICRGGRWNIQISIDGARLVAERSGKYAGQTPVEWTSDGKEWVQVWLDAKPPAAARVGVFRSDFREPMYAVANFQAYNAGGPMWQKMPALMIGKCAEMLALRKAFPQDLSGLYSTEEMQQADTPPQQPTVQQSKQSADEVVEAEVVEEPDTHWLDRIHACTSVEALHELWAEAGNAGILNQQPALKQVFAQRGETLKQEAVHADAE